MNRPGHGTQGRNRRFVIHGLDPRARRGAQIWQGQRDGRENTREQAKELTRIALRRAASSSLAHGTKITNKSQWAYWTEFCNLFDIDIDDFGSIATGQMLPSLEKLRQEEETLAAFMAFVIACPRRGNSNNTANYALQCISTVRSHYAVTNGRRPGLRDGNKTGGRLKVVIRGFQKTNPSFKQPRVPILQQQLKAIRTRLDLQNNRFHKALWALWLTQWQGVLRSSDLIKKARDAYRPWLPANETHRGRLSVDMARDIRGNILGARLKLRLKPNKTDQTGTSGTIKTFIIDDKPGALSAGQAIREMLRTDSRDNGLQMTPLFRNPNTGREITYEESNNHLQRVLREAGYHAPEIGTHSLRIGGATAYANATHGGYAVSGFMGLWASNSRDAYMHACAPRIDMAALEIGRAPDWELAGRPGPVARYGR